MPEKNNCKTSSPCHVAIVSSGYGVLHTEYQFITDTLLNNQFAVVTVQHQRETDPPLSITQPYLKTRAENWQRGTENIRYVINTLTPSYPELNFEHLTLVGHSNGGDISAWYIRNTSKHVHALITLDHRRVPLPRLKNIRVLSIRGSDFPADPNVLYTAEELERYRVCVVTIEKSRHNDMTDHGPTWLKVAIKKSINHFLNINSVDSLCI
ncbi:alpha/beta hydrolase [Shewanella sp. OPT22]|nr:alpha/beta hydrolase [Shewanella sp. OPT22]